MARGAEFGSLASSTNYDLVPSQQAFTDLWPETGIPDSDFWQMQNGWGFAETWWSGYLGSQPNGVVVTITNQTPNLLTVTANSNENSILTANGYVPKLSKTLNPFQSVNFGANDVNHIGGKGISNLQVTFGVFDPIFPRAIPSPPLLPA
jgi:hypothetical protein